MKLCETHTVKTVIVKIENQGTFANVQCFGFTIGITGVRIGEVNLPRKRFRNVKILFRTSILFLTCSN